MLATDLPVCPSAPQPQETTLPSSHRRRVWSRPHAIWRSNQKIRLFCTSQVCKKTEERRRVQGHVHVYALGRSSSSDINRLIVFSNSVPSSWSRITVLLGSWKIARKTEASSCMFRVTGKLTDCCLHLKGVHCTCMLQFLQSFYNCTYGHLHVMIHATETNTQQFWT